MAVTRTHKMRVCGHCLQAIECHEGKQFAREVDYWDFDADTTCEWCGEDCEGETLYDILFE